MSDYQPDRRIEILIDQVAETNRVVRELAAETGQTNRRVARLENGLARLTRIFQYHLVRDHAYTDPDDIDDDT